MKFSNTACCTDGETIFLSPPPNDLDLPRRWVFLEAGAIHEAWHILFQSDIDLLKEFVKKYENKFKSKIPFIGKISKDVVNIIEDGRIEELGKKRFHGNRLAIDYANSYWLKKRPSFKEKPKWQIFIEAILEISLTNGIKERIEDKYLEKLCYVSSFYIYWAKKQENCRASFEAADKIIPLLLEFFELEGNYSSETPPLPEVKPQNKSKEECNPPPLPKEMQEILKELKEEIKKQDQKREKKKENQIENKEKNKSTKEEQKKKQSSERKSGRDKSPKPNERKGSYGKQSETEDLEQISNEKGQSIPSEKLGSNKNEKNEETNQKEQNESSDITDSNNKTLNEKYQEERESDSSKNVESQENAIKNLNENSKTQQNKKQHSKSNLSKSNSSKKYISGKLGSRESGGMEKEEQDTPNKLNEMEVPIVNSQDLDPFKRNLIDTTSLRIKIDDLTKRNIKILKDKELERKINNVLKRLRANNDFIDVFKTETNDIGIVMPIHPNSYSSAGFERIRKSINNLIHITVNQFKSLFKLGTDRTSQLKSGRLDTKQIVRGIVRQDPHIFKKNLLVNSRNQIAITLLIDQSGSMNGPKIENARLAAILFSEVLSALDISFSVYGWTDINYPRSHTFNVNIPQVREPFPREINPEIFTLFAYKNFDEDYYEIKSKLADIISYANNSDHNAINYSTKQLLKTKKKLKVLLVLSDGQPSAGTYSFQKRRLQNLSRYNNISLYYEAGNIGINLTRQAVENARQKHIHVLCISIDSATNYQKQIYGEKNFLVINPVNISELPNRVANLLRFLLRQAGIKV